MLEASSDAGRTKANGRRVDCAGHVDDAAADAVVAAAAAGRPTETRLVAGWPLTGCERQPDYAREDPESAAAEAKHF